LTSSSCTLAWERPSFDGGSEIKGYYVERSTGYSSRFVKVNRDPINKTQQTYNDLVEGTEYEYRVLAENEAGISKPSETTGVFVAKDPYGKPGKPGTPTVKDISKGSATIEWEAPDSDGGAEITHYVVEVRHVPVRSDVTYKVQKYNADFRSFNNNWNLERLVMFLTFKDV